MPSPKDLLLSVVTTLVDDEAIPARLLALGNAAAILMMADQSLTAIFTPAFGGPETLRARLHEIVDKNPGVHIKLAIIGGGLEERALMPRGGGLLSRRAVQLFHLGRGDEGWSLWTGGGARADSPLGQVLERAGRGELPPADPEALAKRADPPAPLSKEEHRRMEEGQAFIASLKVRPYATWILLGVLAAIYLCEVWWGGSESLPTLVRMGGNTDATLVGEPWRLLSSALLHAGLLHIAVNGYVLVMLGGFMEKVLGPGRYGVLLGGAALGGGLASALVSPAVVSVGASGAIWGVLGAAAALAWRPGDAIPDLLVKPLRRNAMINLVLGLTVSFLPQVDLWAHLGGGLAGAVLVLSGVLTRGLEHSGAQREAEGEAEPPKTAQSRRWTIAAGVVAGVMALALVLAWVNDRPWQLAEDISWARREVTTGVALTVPTMLGEAEPVRAQAGEQAWAFGDELRDPLTITVVLTVPSEAARNDALLRFGSGGLERPENTEEHLAWREREAEGGPCYETEYLYPNGLIAGYWVQVRGDTILSLHTLRWPGSEAHWGRGTLERVYASLEGVAGH